MKTKFFLFGLTLLTCSLVTSCGGDDDSSTNLGSASIIIDGVTYTSPPDEGVVFSNFSFGDEVSYSIYTPLANGSDTVFLTIDVPTLSEETYTQEMTDVDVALSVLIQSELTTYYAIPPFSELEQLAEYELVINRASSENLAGEFSGVLYDPLNEQSIEVQGDFDAISFSQFFSI